MTGRLVDITSQLTGLLSVRGMRHTNHTQAVMIAIIIIKVHCDVKLNDA